MDEMREAVSNARPFKPLYIKMKGSVQGNEMGIRKIHIADSESALLRDYAQINQIQATTLLIMVDMRMWRRQKKL